MSEKRDLERQAGNASNTLNAQDVLQEASETSADSSVSDDYRKRYMMRTPVMVDAEGMKAAIRKQAMTDPYDVAKFYWKFGIWQKIARAQKFENITLSVIAFNALWISIDTDLNDAPALLQAHPVFQIAEHGFCLYFALEWFIRYKSFRRKRDGLKDGWFVFDSCLVFMMVAETWVLTIFLLAMGAGEGGGMEGTSMLRMLRLLRLSRMARMARLLRAMPDLLILIKAMASSLRACSVVFLLSALQLYVFAIAFRQLTDGTASEDLQFAFSSVPRSMYTLWIDGTILDGPGTLTLNLYDESPVLAVVFWIFVMLSALTVMNMLIGVLCEVVSAVAATEKEEMLVSLVKDRLQFIMTKSGLDEDGNGEISKAELSKLIQIPQACEALREVGVDVFQFIDNIDFFFAADDDVDADAGVEKALSFEDFMELILNLRGSNTATVKDIVDLKKFIKQVQHSLREEIYQISRHKSTKVQGDVTRSTTRTSSRSGFAREHSSERPADDGRSTGRSPSSSGGNLDVSTGRSRDFGRECKEKSSHAVLQKPPAKKSTEASTRDLPHTPDILDGKIQKDMGRLFSEQLLPELVNANQRMQKCCELIKGEIELINKQRNGFARPVSADDNSVSELLMELADSEASDCLESARQHISGQVDNTLRSSAKASALEDKGSKAMKRQTSPGTPKHKKAQRPLEQEAQSRSHDDPDLGGTANVANDRRRHPDDTIADRNNQNAHGETIDEVGGNGNECRFHSNGQDTDASLLDLPGQLGPSE